MSTSKIQKVPAYRHHKPSGRAVATFNGKDIYLGDYGSRISRERYDRLIAEYKLHGCDSVPTAIDGLVVTEIIQRYWDHATEYYRDPDGSPTSELSCLKMPLRLLRRMYGELPGNQFGPIKLDTVRSEMVRLGWSRRSINKQVARIKRVFKWAVSREYVEATVYHALCSVAGLEAGRSKARETDPIRPVADEVVEATIEHLSTTVATMVRVQRLTGARPGEICQLRTADLDRSGAVWAYTPQRHKNSYRGHARTIFIGPKAQTLLTAFLKPLNPTAFIFSPADSAAEMRERRAAARKTPIRPGHHYVPKSNPKRQPGDRYRKDAYHVAIARACDSAFPAPAPMARLEGETAKAWHSRLTPEQRTELRQWKRAHRWHPHQLRHSAATEIRKRFGLEGAQTVLGHASANVTELYAEKNGAAAGQIALQIG